MVWLLLVVLAVEGSFCPSHQCREHVNSTCLSTEGGTVYISQCAAGSYCPTESSDARCEVERGVWPGERCLSSAGCISGWCESGACRGKEAGESCQSHTECNAPLYCNLWQKCDVQLYESSWISCRDDYDCRNYLTCQFGACVPYLSRWEGEAVSDCVGNTSQACESTLCSFGRCLKALSNDKPLPVQCTSSADCVSTWYSSESRPFPLYTNCSCALDSEGRGVCDLFPGDPPYQDFLIALQHVLQRKHNWACHTLRRFSLECLEASEHHGQYADLRHKYMFAKHHAAMVYSKPCVQAVYFPAYLSTESIQTWGMLLLVILD